MRRGRALSEYTSALNAFFIAEGGSRLPGLEQCAQAAAFPRMAALLRVARRSPAAGSTAHSSPGAASGESSGDIGVINCEQGHLSAHEAMTLPCAYCRAQYHMLGSGKAIWLVPGFDLQSNPWET